MIRRQIFSAIVEGVLLHSGTPPIDGKSIACNPIQQVLPVERV